ncbi:t-SNARE [Bombardia bombarda]|uniref:t-SNARE n=1 Tax=Bombardia bombarda TaxID=252184 RepID=A0AA39TKC7_9PEZI|nr:t-SNARE [Bombardia bombarda]
MSVSVSPPNPPYTSANNGPVRVSLYSSDVDGTRPIDTQTRLPRVELTCVTCRYGGRANPFDDRNSTADDSYGAPAGGRAAPAAYGQGPRPGGGGSAPRYNQGPAMGRDEYGSSNVEMSSLSQNAGSFAKADPNAILNECREIDGGIDEIDAQLNQLRMLQERSLTDADTSSGSSTSRQLDRISAETMTMYRSLTDRVRKVKSGPEARQPRNTAQVNRIDRRLKQAIQEYQNVESQFRKKTQDQMARQYRIVRPDATESEVRAAVEDTSGNSQVFQQALMQGNRMGQARSVLNAVQDRHAALQKIESQIIELAQLFEQLNTLIVEQEVVVAQIEQKSEEVVENLDKGNEEIGVAIQTAKKTRKKKWICLGICVAIIVIIVVIVVAYVMINRAANGSSNTTTTTTEPAKPAKRSLFQRSVLDDLQMNTARSVEFAGEAPVTSVYAQSKIVVPNSDFDADKAPFATFAGSGRAQSRAAKEQRRGLVQDMAVVPHRKAGTAGSKRYVVSDDWKPVKDGSADK